MSKTKNKKQAYTYRNEAFFYEAVAVAHKTYGDEEGFESCMEASDAFNELADYLDENPDVEISFSDKYTHWSKNKGVTMNDMKEEIERIKNSKNRG